MPTKDSEVKTARITRETWEKVSKIMEREGVTFSGAVKWMANNIKGEEDRGIEQICKENGISYRRFMEEIEGLYKDGHIYLEGLRVRTKGECNLRELLEICYRLNVDPQEMIDRLARSLQKG